MGIFDVDSFLNDEQEELDTARAVIPVGVHSAFIEALDVKDGTSESGVEWAKLNVKFNITEPGVLAAMEREKVLLTSGYMLDIDEATGRLATGKGKNWQLGQLRAATGKIKGPLSELVGCQVLIEVKHRIYDGKVQEDVKSVTRA
jgi:hypothetical protein